MSSFDFSSLKQDAKVFVAGVDIDGVLRGKLLEKDKFLGSCETGFGFCSVIFGWDIHDRPYPTGSYLSNNENGYSDLIAKPDLTTYRRVPWGGSEPFFLVDFFKPGLERVEACPRGLLAETVKQYTDLGYRPMCGAEIEFFNLDETPHSICDGKKPKPITPGMFGYSLLRPMLKNEYFQAIWDENLKFGVVLEALHTETGPGVYEAAIKYAPALEMADQAVLFKFVTKTVGLAHGVMPTFMAKLYEDLPGCSGHLHFSLQTLDGSENVFAACKDATAGNPCSGMSILMTHWLAGVLEGINSIMPLLAPTVNSYKRLVENYWAPVVNSWGIDNRTTAIRVIAPPTCPPKATRIEVRVGGADINPHLAIAGILACGLEGIRRQMPLTTLCTAGDASKDPSLRRLPSTLREATEMMAAKGSFARRALGDAFVDHYAMTRMNEVGQYERTVTDWERKRYFETV